MFEDAYRAETKSTATEDGVKYSANSEDFDYSGLNWASDLGIIEAKDRVVFEIWIGVKGLFEYNICNQADEKLFHAQCRAFEFQIYGFECTDYCFALVDRKGEESAIGKLLDENYDRLVGKSPVYVEQLNEIRKFLCENGFEKEIAEQDSIFLESIQNRPRHKTVSMAERWESDWK